MNNHIILYVLSSLMLGVIVFVFIFEFVLKRWKCNDNKECVKVLGGDYRSKSKCEDKCQKTKVNTKAFSLSSQVVPPKAKTYSCVDRVCKLSVGEEGACSSLSDCQSDCPQTLVVEKPVYYGYNYGLPYSPYYWEPRFRRRRPWRRRRPLRRRSRSPIPLGPGRRGPGRRGMGRGGMGRRGMGGRAGPRPFSPGRRR